MACYILGDMYLFYEKDQILARLDVLDFAAKVFPLKCLSLQRSVFLLTHNGEMV